MLTPILMSSGFLIGGPKSCVFVGSREEIEPKIAELSATEGYDTDDYTATEVFMKGWRGSVLNPDGSINKHGNWDEEYKALPGDEAETPWTPTKLEQAEARASALYATLHALAQRLGIDYEQAQAAPGKPSDVFMEAARQHFSTTPAGGGDANASALAWMGATAESLGVGKSSDGLLFLARSLTDWIDSARRLASTDDCKKWKALYESMALAADVANRRAERMARLASTPEPQGEVESRSRLRRVAAEKGEPAPRFDESAHASYCGDERPCPPCFANDGPCEDTPKTDGNAQNEIIRLRDLAATCYAGLVAECDLPDAWADVFLAASQGESFTTDDLLPFTAPTGQVPEAEERECCRKSRENYGEPCHISTRPPSESAAVDDGSVDYARTQAYKWLDERDARLAALNSQQTGEG